MTVFFDVADQSYLPTILERDELVEGNSKLQVSQSSAQILGQPIGGGIVALLTAPIAVLIDAMSYVGSAALILSIRERLGGGRAVGADAGLGAAARRRRRPRPTSSRAGDRPARASRGRRRGRRGSPRVRAADGAPGGMRRQIMDGLRYILRHEYLGNIAATTATSNLFGNIGFAIFPVYAYRDSS